MSDFIACQARLGDPSGYVSALGDSVLNLDFTATVLPHLRGSTLFTYLFRRFGYPAAPWDGDKQLVRYVVTTPMARVFLEIRPYLGGERAGVAEADAAELMFGFTVRRDVYRRIEAESRGQGVQYTTKVLAALRTAMADLLRPVQPRDDVALTCYGYNPSSLSTLTPVAPAPIMGLAVPFDLTVDAARYRALLDAIDALGGGNMAVGVQRVIGMAARAIADSETYAR